MVLLILFAFLAGVVTILSPCILPILPIVLTGSLGGGRRRPLGVITGFIASFTFFTLFLSTIVRATGVSPTILRSFSVIVIFFFGVSLVLPQAQIVIEKLFTKLASLSPQQKPQSGFFGGILIGLSLGLVWTPCVGPILASIISLALTGTITGSALFITLSYAAGTALPLLAITYGGRQLLEKVPWLLSNSATIQKAFGLLMILTAVGIYFNIDRKFQTFILERFPQYGVGLTKFEDNPTVKRELEKINKRPILEENTGKSMADIIESNVDLAPEFIAGGEWINTEPLTMEELRGKVVLVDFWTYTCINCIRTFPYIKSWYEKYHDKGLVIVGVHTPEFEFEKDIDNVKKAVKDFGLLYPIMQDNDYATWNAYANRFWPAKYLIDKNGKIRDRHFGEGNYDETEKKIQELLRETGSDIGNISIQNPTYQVEAQTPESYLGYQRLAFLATPQEVQPDKETTYNIPASIPANHFAYSGKWNVGGERAMPSSGASLVFRFNAKEVYLVMRPKNKLSGQVRVLLDGFLVNEEAGEDVQKGIINVDADRLYKLIKLPVGGAHTLTLEFPDGNLELYAFTFG